MDEDHATTKVSLPLQLGIIATSSLCHQYTNFSKGPRISDSPIWVHPYLSLLRSNVLSTLGESYASRSFSLRRKLNCSNTLCLRLPRQYINILVVAAEGFISGCGECYRRVLCRTRVWHEWKGHQEFRGRRRGVTSWAAFVRCPHQAVHGKLECHHHSEHKCCLGIQ
jgi:hypothetical protein